ncbi:hypothetical protein FH972_023380 [Carpinus fangiana]|uniref:Uncharacterized protein n=1 Tax=Carpinus fangiana TaxID=176857 RepID=A0A5N6KV15_9ROSI|nr:hypothetical protein FH972_023380 [Carpinus fangiana]
MSFLPMSGGYDAYAPDPDVESDDSSINHFMQSTPWLHDFQLPADPFQVPSPPLENFFFVPSPDIVRLVPATAPIFTGRSNNVFDEGSPSLEPTRHSSRLSAKATRVHTTDGSYLLTPEATPCPSDSQRPRRDSASSATTTTYDSDATLPAFKTPPKSRPAPIAVMQTPLRRGAFPSATKIANHVERLTQLSSFLDYLQRANRIDGATLFDAPLAYSPTASFETSFDNLRAKVFASRVPPAAAAATTFILEPDDATPADPGPIPFTKARNTTTISFAPPSFATPNERELHERRTSAGLIVSASAPPSIYISTADTQRLDELAAGSESFVFGGCGATSGRMASEDARVGVWYRVLDGALRITAHVEGGCDEDVMLVDGNVSVAVVMMGRAHTVAAVPLGVADEVEPAVDCGCVGEAGAEECRCQLNSHGKVGSGWSSAFVSGAVLFATGFVPMTRLCSREEMGEVRGLGRQEQTGGDCEDSSELQDDWY